MASAPDSMISVRVAVRVRPLSGKELQEGCETALRVIHGRPQITLLNCDKSFTYDFAYDTATPQVKIYNEAVDPLVDKLFKGYNATVLAYGQTGSGKTYTMGTSRSTISPTADAHEGVIARAVTKIFNTISDLKVHYEFKVRVAFVELYKEQLFDLLSPNVDNVVDLREDPRQGVYINNLTEVPVEGPDGTYDSLVKGSSKRATAATAMNSVSSRSHAIFTIFLEGSRHEASIAECNDSMPDTIRAKFHLVDLAGSERAKKTQATGERYKEGVSINLGLLSLGNVIAALGEEGGPRGHISYRDSKLTRLLQDSLGGNSHTLMIACVSPADSNVEETLSTLRYADRARKIKNKPIVNRGDTKEELIRLRRENQELKMQLITGGCGEEVGRELIDLRETVSRLLKENKTLTSTLSTMGGLQTTVLDEEGGDSGDEEHEANQAKLAEQLSNLNEVLAQKEELASTMMANDEKIKELREKYEKSLSSMQEELATLQQERDKLDQATKTAGGNDPKCKIAEQRRKRIQELEAKMQDLQKKVMEQSKALKQHEKTEKMAKKLTDEIAVMKQNKVRLVKQMKEDGEKNRIWKQAKEKEVLKLKQTERKQQVQIAKMESLHIKQKNVMKRKMEEAIMTNKRLQEVLQKQKNAKKDKNMNNPRALVGSMERMKNLVNQELDVVVTMKDAIQSKEQLLKDRASISKQLTDIRSQSRLTLLGSERMEMEKKRKELQSELDMRNVEIANLQKQILDAKQNTEAGENGGSQWYDSIHSMNEAKLALQYLFEKSAELTSSATALKTECSDYKQMFREAASNVGNLEQENAALKLEHEKEKTKLKKEYEEQKSLLLNKLTNPDLAVKQEEFERYSEFQAKLKETMKTKKQKKSPVVDEQYEKFMDSDEDDYEGGEDSDYDPVDDPDWRATPLFRRIKKVKDTAKETSANDLKRQLSKDDLKETSASKRRSTTDRMCKCKSGCKTTKCGCRRNDLECNPECKCVGCFNNKDGQDKDKDDIDNCTAGTMSLLNDTFDISDVKENQAPVNATYNASPRNQFIQPALASSCLKAGQIDERGNFVTPAREKRKTIFQSPLNDTKSPNAPPRPIFQA